MKRHGDLFERIASFPNLLADEKRALRGKRARPAPAIFHHDREPNLFILHDELHSGTYQPGKYRTFWIQDPKKRPISAAPYRDRVVHHAVCRIAEPIFDRGFIFDSYRLRLHSRKCVVIPVRDGVPFLGWRVYPDHRRLRRSSGVRFQRRLRTMAKAYQHGEIGPENIRASLASCLGHLRHGDTHGLVRKLLGETVFRRNRDGRPERG